MGFFIANWSIRLLIHFQCLFKILKFVILLVNVGYNPQNILHSNSKPKNTNNKSNDKSKGESKGELNENLAIQVPPEYNGEYDMPLRLQLYNYQLSV